MNEWQMPLPTIVNNSVELKMLLFFWFCYMPFHRVLNQLRDARMQIQEVGTSLSSMANQAAAVPVVAPTPPASDIQRRPTPRPRVRARVQTSVLVNTAPPVPSVFNPFVNVQAAPAAPVILPQPRLIAQANPTPLIMPDSSSDELDEM